MTKSITKSKPYQIMLADDHILLRDALANYFSNFNEIQISSVACSGKDVIEKISSGPEPDLVVLDLNMPEVDGFDTARWLKNNKPHIKILVLTMYNSEIALIRLLQDGVRGFLKKDVHPDILKAALISIAEDGYYYCNDTTGKLASLFNRSQSNQKFIERAMLSEREIEFLKFVSSDLTYKEIAHQMKITPRAIDGYRDSLFDKLEVKSRVGLALYAVKNGIVTF